MMNKSSVLFYFYVNFRFLAGLFIRTPIVNLQKLFLTLGNDFVKLQRELQISGNASENLQRAYKISGVLVEELQ